MLTAISVKNKVIVSISQMDSSKNYILQRKQKNNSEWETYTDSGFIFLENSDTEKKYISNGDIVDSDVSNGLYTYRIADSEIENPSDEDYDYSNWVKCGDSEAIGYSFNNYERNPNEWGEVICPDDLRYTYLWGTDFKATNGATFTDEQIKFFIRAAVKDIERELNITIVKKHIVCEAKEKGLKKGVDYDVDESYYTFTWAKISRYGMIKTRQRPILEVKNVSLLNRMIQSMDLTSGVIVDKQKGVIKLMHRPIRPTERSQGLAQATGMYGSSTYNCHLFYDIDYTVGYENSDEIPDDLREIIAKQTAISLLNVIGDGLMSGFSSSSLSMDGISESFSSTQSATSAYFGARIAQYKDDIKDYIKANKNKFANLPMGCI